MKPPSQEAHQFFRNSNFQGNDHLFVYTDLHLVLCLYQHGMDCFY